MMILAALSLLGTLREQAWSLTCIYPCSVSSLEPPHAGQAQLTIHTPKDFMVMGLLVNWKIGEFSETN